MKSDGRGIEKLILDKLLSLGASLAGFAALEDLKKAPSYEAYDKAPFYPEYEGVTWRDEHKTVLVWALAHPESKPELDWWNLKIPGFTPGNGELRKQSRMLRLWLEEELGIKALSLPYQIEYGGAFLKDSAALAGLGKIGRHNLLVTPKLGTRVRLRGMFIEAELEPTGPSDFDPCRDCEMPCRRACPRDAFGSGYFDRKLCRLEQEENEVNLVLEAGSLLGADRDLKVIKYCRNCEYACPVANPNP
jgi:epoxyqueuosine reductase